MIKRISLTALLSLFSVSLLLAQPADIERVEPEFWWTGFLETELQLLVYGDDIGSSRASIDYPGVQLKQVISVENPNYLFLYLDVTDQAEPGTFTITFSKGGEVLTHDYTLLEREYSSTRHQGFDSSDLIYLLMPDRFANGDPSNDEIPGMIEGVDMDEPYARKGGDIKGISDNLQYIKDLGMTAIWLNPTFENDMPYNYEIGAGFYHGYAATDMYKVDRRFGTNEEFVEMIRKSQEMGMKVIMDKIHNHVGTHHWFIKDLPMADWIHDQSEVGNTNYRTDTIMDPYASEADFNATVKGWFVDEMPDLNQRNPLLADYLIQNTIWWIEYSGIDGIRMDTHPYPYQEYMAAWTRRLLQEYPDFNIVGEVWMQNVATTAWWQYDFPTQSGYNSYLPSVTDFPLYRSIVSGLNEDAGWDTGLARIYYTLGQDFLYTDPYLNVIFVDNHDLTRFMTSVNEDPAKFKLGLALLLTTRGIPQIYYGTEIMKMGGANDPDKRRLFPGGWPGDEINAFTEEGRRELGEKRNLPIPEVFNYLKTISEWRKDKEVIHTGDLTHFIPENNVYVYFRHNSEETVMVILNGSDEAQYLETARFNEILSGYKKAINILSGKTFELESPLYVSEHTAYILELSK
ncbi:MAG: glycoside hydrolase family 13 protein [Balneolaceae bacterium]|nr:glycoside hydrolase family 13 protein [Balneolaceae bacterium]